MADKYWHLHSSSKNSTLDHCVCRIPISERIQQEVQQITLTTKGNSPPRSSTAYKCLPPRLIMISCHHYQDGHIFPQLMLVGVLTHPLQPLHHRRPYFCLTPIMISQSYPPPPLLPKRDRLNIFLLLKYIAAHQALSRATFLLCVYPPM